MSRWCIDCNQNLPDQNFGPKGGPGRERHLASVCRECKAVRAREWRKAHVNDADYHEHERQRMRILRALKRGEQIDRLPDRRKNRPKRERDPYPWETWG